jgi:hypothetical protein
MNPIVKSLIEESNLSDFLAPNQKYRAKDLEKFAELMVRECLKVVQDGGGMCGSISSNNIKQHFGLEE